MKSMPFAPIADLRVAQLIDANLDRARHRRGLALASAGVCSLDAHEKIAQMYSREPEAKPITGCASVTIAQEP